MMKTKKSGLLVILALAMVLALSCSAWAATHYAKFSVNGTSEPNASGDITVSGDYYHGLWARSNGGRIVYTGGTIITSGDYASGALAHTYGVIQGTGTIVTSGDYAYGLEAVPSGDITWTGSITTNDDRARGVQVNNASSVDLTGSIVTYGEVANGFNVGRNSYGSITGNITTYGNSAAGVIASSTGAQLFVTGNISTSGILAVAISATDNGTVTMSKGTIEIFATDEGTYALGMGNDGIINLQSVNVMEERLLLCGGGTVGRDSSGILNITENSVLTGNIIHEGTTADTLQVNLDNSNWSGAAEASGDIGTIDITLESSDWIVTGSSDTNGKVTADEDSNIDFRGTDETIVVEIDNLVGAPGLNIKLDDELIIKNPDAADSFQSSDPSVVEVVVDPDTGAVSIIPRSDGDAELTYSYIDENGKIQTVTIGVVSGSGSDPTGGGGGSSNCNSGVGAAMFALLGLAFVYKKK